jgi:hypothetical protein
VYNYSSLRTMRSGVAPYWCDLTSEIDRIQTFQGLRGGFFSFDACQSSLQSQYSSLLVAVTHLQLLRLRESRRCPIRQVRGPRVGRVGRSRIPRKTRR